MIGEFGVSERVTLIEEISPERWQSLVAKSDIALHLTSNPHTRVSPYLELSLAAGVPAVVMRVGRGETMSQDIVFSIEPGLHETAQLVGIFEALAAEDGRQYGRAGQNLVKVENHPAHVAARLTNIFRESAPLLADVMRAWGCLYSRAESALLTEVQDLVDLPTGGMPGAYERIVKPFVEEIQRRVGQRGSETVADSSS
jgi:hypothetical protein